jgi:membrane protein YqaA with SNARE-associated domain
VTERFVRKRGGIEGTGVANRIAFIWGLAEATVFFVVPDVWLTRLAVRDFRRAFVASLWALAGAILGGIILWSVARHGAAEKLFAAFDRLPGISPALIQKSGSAMVERGLVSLATGALAGQPYKLYAVHAGALGVAFVPFLFASLAARFARFLLTSIIARAIGRMFEHRGERFLLQLHGIVWLVFYLGYFSFMRG